MVEITEKDMPGQPIKTTAVEIIGDNAFSVQCQITQIMCNAADNGGDAEFINPVRQADGKWTSRGYYTTAREIVTDETKI